jgi:hypothetical protein
MADLIGQQTLGWAGVGAGIAAIGSTLLPSAINATTGSGFPSAAILGGGILMIGVGGALAVSAPK